jgi:hypothetical protein
MICLRYSIVTAQKRNKMVSDHPWYITLACLQQEYFQVSISRWIPYPWYFPLIIFQELTTSLLTNYKLLYFGLNVSFLHKHETPIAVVPLCIKLPSLTIFMTFFFSFTKWILAYPNSNSPMTSHQIQNTVLAPYHVRQCLACSHTSSALTLSFCVFCHTRSHLTVWLPWCLSNTPSLSCLRPLELFLLYL